MKERFSSFFRSLAVAGVLLLASLSPLSADSLQKEAVCSATMEITVRGERSTTRIWTMGGMVRMEVGEEKETSVLITDYRKKTCWARLPGMPHFHEFPLERLDHSLPPLFAPNIRSEKKLVGPETIDGQKSLKYAIHMEALGQTWTGTLWEDPDLKFPLRWVDSERSLAVTWSNLKILEPGGAWFKVVAEECDESYCSCPNAINGKPCGNKKNFRWKFFWEEPADKRNNVRSS